jgi:hypothetical protein
MWSFSAIKTILAAVSANGLILVLLLTSAAYNLVVTSRAGSAWWTERRAVRFMNRIGVGPNTVMSRAIYLKDLEDLARGSVVLWEGHGPGNGTLWPEGKGGEEEDNQW